jgi:hypothetical protein
LAENQPFPIADSIGEARERLASELRAQGEQIQKLNLELTELQLLHERAELESARQWDAVADAAELAAAAAKPQASPDRVLENVLGAIRGLITCTIPEQVMRTLTEEASQWGVRAAIFDVRGRSAWGAFAHGFGPALTENAFRSLIVQLSQDNPFRQVCETAGDVEASAETLKKNRNVLDKLKPAPNAPVLLLPIRSAGTVTAIFYADPGESGESLPVNALKILAEFAGAQIDRLIALSGGFAEAAAPEAIEEPTAVEVSGEEGPSKVAVEEVAPAETHTQEPVDVAAHAGEPVVEGHTASESEAEPSATEAHREVEVLESFAPVTEPPAEVADARAESAAPPEGVTQGLSSSHMESHVEPVDPHSEVTAEFPAPSAVMEEQAPPPPLESTPESSEVVQPVAENESAPSTAEQAADAVDSPSFINPPSPVTVGESPTPSVPAVPVPFDVSQLSEAEQKIHKDAKRFAKLLVSEIELYNKAKVAEGRKNWDLYKRLKTDIDRSRLTFEKRFGKALSKQVDYFHDELVKILAANDSEVLGPGYPGPSA